MEWFAEMQDPQEALMSERPAGHSIQSTSNSGSIIVLEDGSMWEINAMDRIDTALWLPITDITVLRASSRIGECKYVLVNKDDGEKALAKYLGKE